MIREQCCLFSDLHQAAWRWFVQRGERNRHDRRLVGSLSGLRIQTMTRPYEVNGADAARWFTVAPLRARAMTLRAGQPYDQADCNILTVAGSKRGRPRHTRTST